MARPLVKYDFDPFSIAGVTRRNFTESDVEDIMDEVSNYVKEQVLIRVGNAESPVNGHGKFKDLKKDYAEEEHGGDRTARLELEGDLLDSVKVIQKGNKLRLTVDDDQQPKADGHNNFSGKSKLPTRRFIPKEPESFDDDMIKEIKNIVLERLDAQE